MQEINQERSCQTFAETFKKKAVGKLQSSRQRSIYERAGLVGYTLADA